MIVKTLDSILNMIYMFLGWIQNTIFKLLQLPRQPNNIILQSLNYIFLMISRSIFRGTQLKWQLNVNKLINIILLTDFAYTQKNIKS